MRGSQTQLSRACKAEASGSENVFVASVEVVCIDDLVAPRHHIHTTYRYGQLVYVAYH